MDRETLVAFYINGHYIDGLENTIPDGRYRFRFPGQLINTGLDSPAQNYLTIEVDGIGAGQYIVATDFKIVLMVDKMDVDLCVPPPPVICDPPEICVPPPAKTKITQIGPKNKFRPGDTVPVEVILHNNDTVNHTGILTITLKNNSYTGDGEGVGAEVQRGRDHQGFEIEVALEHLLDHRCQVWHYRGDGGAFHSAEVDSVVLTEGSDEGPEFILRARDSAGESPPTNEFRTVKYTYHHVGVSHVDCKQHAHSSSRNRSTGCTLSVRPVLSRTRMAPSLPTSRKIPSLSPKLPVTRTRAPR